MPMAGSFIVFIGVVLCGMSVIAMNIWGPFMQQFSAFTDAFMSVLFFQMGLLDFETMREVNMVWSFVYIIIYCLFVIYLLMSSFMLIFVDSYRRLVIQYGSLMQPVHGPHLKHSHFTNRTRFFRWFFGWLPETCVRRIGNDEDAVGEGADGERKGG